MIELSDYPVKSVPYIKTLLGALKFVENPIPVINEAIAEYGPTYYTRIVGGKKIVMSIDPDVVQHILQKNNKNYRKSELQTESLGKYIGYGLLTINGEYWLKQRRLIQPGFHKAKIEALVQTMYSELQDYIADLKVKIKTNPSLNIAQEMMELTLRIVSKSLFSTGISSDQITELGVAFTELQEHIIKEVRQPMFNWYRHLTGQMKKAHDLAEETKDIMRRVIAERLEHPSENDDFLDMLINSRYEDTGESMTKEQLLDEALILFTAGHETTANALTWGLYTLHSHPESINQIRKEYQRISVDGISMATLMTGEYANNVISEIMRLYPPAWILDRVAIGDDQIKNVSIGAGDLIGLYVYGTHRDSRVWNRPNDFIPERFDKENKKAKHSYAYYPFGGGPRLCIGNHFAMLEMQMALYELLAHFDWEWDASVEVIAQPLITLRPKNGVQMKISERNN